MVAGKERKILVTGATGFVGRAVVTEFGKHNDFEVLELAGKRRTREIPAQNSQAKFFSCDVSDLNSFPEIRHLKNTEILIHTAGLAHQFGPVKRDDFWRVNVKGTKNVCKFARDMGVGHFVLIGSVSVYGDYGNAKIDESYICKPASFYAESKLESENAAIDFCEKNAIPLTILRLATVIGENDPGNTMRLITRIDKNRFIWIGNGKNKKSLIYKNDVAKGVFQAIQQKGKYGTEIFNLTNEPVSMKEIVDVIARQLNKNIPKLKIRENLLRSFFRFNNLTFAFNKLKNFENTIQKWLSDDIFSGDKFYERFQYKPETRVDEALARQVNFYLEQKKARENNKSYSV